MSSSADVPLGSLLRTYRLTAAMSQEELAERSGVSVRTISDLERGVRATARFETVRMLANGLELSPHARAAMINASIEHIGRQSIDSHQSADVITSSLVEPGNRLIGRETYLQSIFRDHFDLRGVVWTLTGPGGVGKTRVAIEIATRVARKDGVPVCFVPLVGIRHHNQVAAAVGQILETPFSKGTAEESVIRWLENRRGVLVLDNAEQVLEAGPFIGRIAASAREVTVLVTSRSRLHVSNEYEIPVPPLELPPVGARHHDIVDAGAVQLFAERAGMLPDIAQNEEDAASIAEICRRLDGLPLALELAAPRLRLMPLSRLQELLDHRLNVLTRGPRDLPDHQQSMRDTIGWSYDLLQPTQQRLFRWLSVYVNDFSGEAVEHVGQAVGIAPGVAVFDELDGLLESGLVQKMPDVEGQRRFRLLETVREFGQERLDELNEHSDARTAHADFIFKTISAGAPQPFSPTDPNWLGRVSADAANALAAFDWVCQPESAEKCADIAAVMGGYWEKVGPCREQAIRMRGVRHLFPEGTARSELIALFWTMALSTYGGEFEEAETLCEHGLTRARDLGDLWAEAAFLHARGWHFELAERFEEAEACFEEASGYWAVLDEPLAIAQVSMLRGGISCARGDLVQARALMESAQLQFVQMGDGDYWASTEWYLGFFDVAEGKWASAASHFLQAMERYILLRSDAGAFKAALHLADVAAAAGDFEAATTLMGVSEFLRDRSGETLFPFDFAARDRVTNRCREALGDAQYDEGRARARAFEPIEWLRLGAHVVELAESASLEATTK